MKKLLLSIGLLSGVMLSSATANAACVAADCAALGYSTATVEGCTRYIVCPFDTSYKACASTSSETTGTMTCEDAIAAVGGIYIDDGGYMQSITHSENRDVTYYSHCGNYDSIVVNGSGKLTFRRVTEIPECADQAVSDDCDRAGMTWKSQYIVIGNNNQRPVEIEVNWPEYNYREGTSTIEVGSIILETGASPIFNFYADNLSIKNFSMINRSNIKSPLINVMHTPTNSSAYGYIGVACKQEGGGNCPIRVNVYGQGTFQMLDCRNASAQNDIWGDGYTGVDFTCVASGYSSSQCLQNYGDLDGTVDKYRCVFNDYSSYL